MFYNFVNLFIKVCVNMFILIFMDRVYFIVFVIFNLIFFFFFSSVWFVNILFFFVNGVNIKFNVYIGVFCLFLFYFVV